MEAIRNFFDQFFSKAYFPKTVRIADVIEMIVIGFLVYHLIVWIKKTKAWNLLKGFVVIVIFIVLAAVFQMSTILWMVENVLSIAVIALVIVLQPELRKALETLGQKNIFSTVISFDNSKGGTDGKFSDKTVTEIIHACEEMSKVKTGALIVIERNVSLADYERTGIEVDAVVSSQLLINIFEHNTPLHDGAIIMRGNRIISATCYLPLSDNRQLSKQLGTRHRAAVGISEETDALTVVVSEETGRISVTNSGKIIQNITLEQLKEQLIIAQDKALEEKKVHFFWEGRSKREKLKNRKK